MGRHGSKHGFGYDGYRTGSNYGVLGGIPRGLKIVLAVFALFIVLVVVVVAVLVILVLLKLLSGGSLPTYLQEAFDFLQRNVQPLLNLWKSLQGLAGK